MDFIQSKIKEFICSPGATIFIYYVDDSILIDPDSLVINKVIMELKERIYNLMDEGEIDNYLKSKSRDSLIEQSDSHSHIFLWIKSSRT
jgi:hypothetical protein